MAEQPETQNDQQSYQKTTGLALNGIRKLGRSWKKISLIVGALIIVLLSIMMFMLIISTLDNSDGCKPKFQSNNQSGKVQEGEDLDYANWKDTSSTIYKNMKYTADRFQKEVGMSGDNIAAALAIGVRESQFDPTIVNPGSGAKGVFQWLTSGSYNRYFDTKDTIEAQIDLAIKELNSSHQKALLNLKDADLDASIDAWDTHFEGLLASDLAQRKTEETTARAVEIKKFFKLDFDGNILEMDGKPEDLDAIIESTGQSKKNSCSNSRGRTSTGLPVEGTYSITGGYPNYNGQNGAAHYGVDFQTSLQDDEHNNVFSVHDGTVLKVGYDDAGGHHIIIKGNDGVFSYYGHAPSKEAIQVKQGDEVKKGQHISKQGQTGQATGNHVHFGVNKDEDAVVSGAGFMPEAEGIFSPAEYLKDFPKNESLPPALQGSGTVVPGGPYDVPSFS